jgi:hypothetical protein
MSVPSFTRQVFNAYIGLAQRLGWHDIPRDSMDLYVLVDASIGNNFPRIQTGRPLGQHEAFRINAKPNREFGAVKDQMVPEPGNIQESMPATLPMHGGLSQAPTDNLDQPFTDQELKDWFEGSEADLWLADLEKLPGPSDGPVLRCGATVVARLDHQHTTVGRSEISDVVIPHPTVSKQHASIDLADGTWTLTPLEGRPCTVNGRIVSTPVGLTDGDKMSFARSQEIFTFRDKRHD